MSLYYIQRTNIVKVTYLCNLILVNTSIREQQKFAAPFQIIWIVLFEKCHLTIYKMLISKDSCRGGEERSVSEKN